MTSIYDTLSLNDFTDAKSFYEPINISGYQVNELKKFLSRMYFIRIAEQRLANARRDGLIGGPVHLSVGQEAVAVGVSASLRSTDRVFGAHRSHSHLLALGSDVRKLFAEVLGKETGLSKGMGGSMHLWDQSVGFYGSVPIVAGTVSLAVGAALAAKMQKKSDIGVAYLGDGAVEEGVVHESLNLARLFNLPIIFVVENNMFASHMHISERQPNHFTARFARANLIQYDIVDGNNVVNVANSAKLLINNCRQGSGPAFLEVFTYRWYGHVDWRDDVDVGINRSASELASWRKKDPIARLETALIDAGLWCNKSHLNLIEDLEVLIDRAWAQAMSDPFPSVGSLLQRVYAVG